MKLLPKIIITTLIVGGVCYITCLRSYHRIQSDMKAVQDRESDRLDEQARVDRMRKNGFSATEIHQFKVENRLNDIKRKNN